MTEFRVCGNCLEPCSETFSDMILSTWNNTRDCLSTPTSISVSNALSVVFEISPLKLAQHHQKQDQSETDNGEFPARKDCKFSTKDDDAFLLCQKCSELLKDLYNTLQNFVSICKLESEIGKVLKELELAKRNKDIAVGSRRRDVIKREPAEDNLNSSGNDGDDDEFNRLSVDNVKLASPESLPEHGSQAGDPFYQENVNSSGIDCAGEDFATSRRSERLSSRRKQRYRDSSEEYDTEPESKFSRSSRKQATLSAFQCPECGKRFLYQATLYCHLRIIHRNTKIPLPPPLPVPKPRLPFGNLSNDTKETSKCLLCHVVLPRGEIRNHLLLHTKGTLSYKKLTKHKKGISCLYCKEMFPRNEILAHLRQCATSRVKVKSQTSASLIRGGPGLWSCKLCGIRFTNRQEMAEHMRTHMQRKLLKCKICDKRYDRNDLLRLHMIRFHKNNCGPSSVRPTEAGQIHNDDSNLDDPDPLEPGGESAIGGNPEEAGTSSAKCDNISGLAAQKRFACAACSEAFSKEKDLDSHLLNSHADEGTSTCGICNRKLKDSFCLRLHLKSHGEILPFSCHLCKKEYKEKSYLYHHLKEAHALDTDTIVSQHPDIFNKETSYLKGLGLKGRLLYKPLKDKKCNICGREFSNNTMMQKHKKIVHDKIKNFCCSYCGKTFGTKSYFLLHEKLHTSTETPFKCHLCEKGFRLPGNLRAHLQSSIHNPEKNFICETCGKGFNRKENLRVHVDKVHLKIQSQPRGGNFTTGGRNRVYGPDEPVAAADVSNMESNETSREEALQTETIPIVVTESDSKQNQILSGIITFTYQ